MRKGHGSPPNRRTCRALSRSAPGTTPVRFPCKTSRKPARAAAGPRRRRSYGAARTDALAHARQPQPRARLFVRGVAAPSDRSEFDRYADTGLTFRGAFAWRPMMWADCVRLGHISPAAAADDRALAALTAYRSRSATMRPRSTNLSVGDCRGLVGPAGYPIYFPSRRQYRQPGESGVPTPILTRLCWGCGWRWSFRAIRRRRGEARQLAEKWYV